MKLKIAIPVGVVLLAGTFFAGRFTAPDKIKTVTVEKRVEVIKETQVVRQEINLEELKKIVASIKVKVNVVKEHTETVLPDGSKTTHDTTTDKTETDSKSETDTKNTAKTETETKIWKETVRVEEHIKIVEKLKNPDTWTLGVQTGVSIPALAGRDVPNYVPGLPQQVMVGGFLTKRLIGPISGGVFINSHGDAGLQVSLGF